MDRFIELRFGQCTDVQREIVPVSSINTIYVDMIDPSSIVVDFTINGKTFRRKEYYENTCQCNCRWNEVRRILGVADQVLPGKGNPIPMESDDWFDLEDSERIDLCRRMNHSTCPEDGDDDE